MLAAKRIARISNTDMVAIELAFRKHWLPNDSLWIFGSRVNQSKKGGDIDLYIETSSKNIDDALEMKQKFISDLIDKIGEQKIDVVLSILSLSKHLPIYEVARAEGVKFL